MLPATLLRICGLFAVLMLIPGCTATTRSAADPAALTLPTQFPLPARPSGDVILAGEIQSARLPNAYEAVMRLRPEFLTRRAVSRPEAPNGQPPSIFVDDLEQPELEMLRTVPATAILEIRYLTASAATPKFGPRHAGGVIAVRTKR